MEVASVVKPDQSLEEVEASFPLLLYLSPSSSLSARGNIVKSTKVLSGAAGEPLESGFCVHQLFSFSQEKERTV